MNKKYIKNKDTIAAIASPIGTGGVSVIRVSGDKAYELSSSLLSKKNFVKNVATVCTLDTGEVMDEIIAIYFKAPQSFTGEDVFEIHCHGGYFLTDKILEALIKAGCRLAEPGEFTKRAFFNNKLDLTAAEGVIDLISASGESAVNSAFGALRGETFRAVESIQNDIKAITASASAAIDYPEEDIEEETVFNLKKQINGLKDGLKTLISSFNAGRYNREGVKIVIYGEPNVGKSTLLNRLCGVDRAIVTDEPGTTRDTVSESYVYKGVRFNLTDTAGVRKNASLSDAELKGIERSEEAVREADIVLAVSECGKAFNLGLDKNKRIIYVKNKADKVKNGTAENVDTVFISALNGYNTDKLKEEVFNKTAGNITVTGAGLNNLRQLSGALEALAALERALKAPNTECILSDLLLGYRALGTVTGITASDEIIDEIFRRFCVGK